MLISEHLEVTALDEILKQVELETFSWSRHPTAFIVKNKYKMKVLHLDIEEGGQGGSSRSLRYLVQGLKKMNVDSEVCMLSQDHFNFS